MKVLLIEDDAYTVELMTVRLETLGCDVHVADSAETAVGIAERERPNLVLADLNLHGTLENGLDVLRQLHEHPATAETPVLIHSVYVSSANDVPEAQALADGFLLKPFKLRDLKDLIAQHGHPAEATEA